MSEVKVGDVPRRLTPRESMLVAVLGSAVVAILFGLALHKAGQVIKLNHEKDVQRFRLIFGFQPVDIQWRYTDAFRLANEQIKLKLKDLEAQYLVEELKATNLRAEHSAKFKLRVENQDQFNYIHGEIFRLGIKLTEAESNARIAHDRFDNAYNVAHSLDYNVDEWYSAHQIHSRR